MINNWGGFATEAYAPNAQANAAKQLDGGIPEAVQKILKEKGLPVTPDGLLMLWSNAKKDLETAKNFEMEIRKTAVKVYVPKPVEGMNTVELGNGFNLKAGVKFNYNLDKDNTKVEKALDRISALGNEGPFIVERLVSWTPNFLLTEYRKLGDDAQAGSEFAKQALKIIGDVLTITDASPTLEIKEPKGKK